MVREKRSDIEFIPTAYLVLIEESLSFRSFGKAPLTLTHLSSTSRSPLTSLLLPSRF